MSLSSSQLLSSHTLDRSFPPLSSLGLSPSCPSPLYFPSASVPRSPSPSFFHLDSYIFIEKTLPQSRHVLWKVATLAGVSLSFLFLLFLFSIFDFLFFPISKRFVLILLIYIATYAQTAIQDDDITLLVTVLMVCSSYPPSLASHLFFIFYFLFFPSTPRSTSALNSPTSLSFIHSIPSKSYSHCKQVAGRKDQCTGSMELIIWGIHHLSYS